MALWLEIWSLKSPVFQVDGYQFVWYSKIQDSDPHCTAQNLKGKLTSLGCFKNKNT
jgi:hypothetical protein